MGTAPTSQGKVLNSWKEIASYLGRGVRTVQRYERDLSLPVRRPRGKSRSAVIAFSDELDAWLHSAPKQELVGEYSRDGNGNGNGDTAVVVRSVIHEAVQDAAELRQRCHELRAAHHDVLSSLISNLRTTTEIVRSLRATREPASR